MSPVAVAAPAEEPKTEELKLPPPRRGYQSRKGSFMAIPMPNGASSLPSKPFNEGKLQALPVRPRTSGAL